MLNNWCVYLLQCNDGSFYCGITNNLDKRISDHNSGKGAKYTRAKKPVSLLIATDSRYSKSEASKLEYQCKQLPKTKKRDFIDTNK